MKYCSKCGSKIEESDGFCPSCGGVVNKNSAENPNQEKTGQTFEHVKSIANKINFAEIINNFKTSVLNPVSGGEEFVDKTQKSHVIIITIILTLLQGILGIWRVNQIISCLSTLLVNFVHEVSSLAILFGQSSSSLDSSNLDSINKTINQFKYLNIIPYEKVFIGNCGLYLVGLFILFISVYLAISLFTKAKCTPFLVFKAVLISTLPIFICEIISILFSYFSFYSGIGFAILGVLISITTLAIIVKDSFQLNANACVLIISISAVITLAVLCITFSYQLTDIFKAIIYKYGNSLIQY